MGAIAVPLSPCSARRLDTASPMRGAPAIVDAQTL
jgi:hypothetical protein